jgi:hypothetical protein
VDADLTESRPVASMQRGRDIRRCEMGIIVTILAIIGLIVVLSMIF